MLLSLAKLLSRRRSCTRSLPRISCGQTSGAARCLETSADDEQNTSWQPNGLHPRAVPRLWDSLLIVLPFLAFFVVRCSWGKDVRHIDLTDPAFRLRRETSAPETHESHCSSDNPCPPKPWSSSNVSRAPSQYIVLTSSGIGPTVDYLEPDSMAQP